MDKLIESNLLGELYAETLSDRSIAYYVTITGLNIKVPAESKEQADKWMDALSEMGVRYEPQPKQRPPLWPR